MIAVRLEGQILGLEEGRFDGALQCFVLGIVVGPVANPIGLFGKLQPRMGERDPERPVVFVDVATGPTQAIERSISIWVIRTRTYSPAWSDSW